MAVPVSEASSPSCPNRTGFVTDNVNVVSCCSYPHLALSRHPLYLPCLLSRRPYSYSCREEMAHQAQVVQLQEETISSLIQEVFPLRMHWKRFLKKATKSHRWLALLCYIHNAFKT